MELYENLVVKQEKGYVLLNLYNFKIEYLTADEFRKLEAYVHKGDLSGKQIFECFKKKGQFLTDKQIAAIDLYARIKSKQLGKPALCEVQISLSFECNLSCYYCYQRGRHGNERMGIDDIDKIYEFCELYENKMETQNKIQWITITGGEPLLEQNIILINRIAEKFRDAHIRIFTNGINLQKYWHKLPLDRIAEIQISLDGDDKIISKISGKRELCFSEKILKSIHLAVSSGCNVRVGCVLTEVSVERVKIIYDLLEREDLLKYNNLHIAFTLVTDYKNELGIARQYDLKKLAKEINGMRGVFQQYKNSEITIFSDLMPIKSLLKDYFDINRFHVGRRCGRLHGMGITAIPGGGIYWCNERIGENGKIGDYSKGIFYKERYDEISQRNVYKINECQKCKFRFVCGAGCPIKIGENVVDWKERYCGVFGNSYIMDNLQDFILF